MMARLKRLFGRMSGIQIFIALMCAYSSNAVAQITINIFDFDGTVVEDRQTRDGAFNPEFILYRNNTRLNLLQEVSSGPEVVHVTHQDLEKMRPYLATGEGRPGAIGRVVRLSNGESIKPGEYYLRNPDSYRFFREGPENQNYLLAQFQMAEKAARENGKTFKGPAWDYLVKLCETPEGARTVAFSTARGHAQREWAAFFNYLHERGYIKFKPNPRRAFGMARPEADRYNGGGGALGGDQWNVSARKGNHLRELLLDLRAVALPETKPGEKRVLHEINFFENSPANLDAISRATREILFADMSPTRVTLVNVGLSTDIREARESGRPEVAVLEPGSAVFKSGSREAFLLPGAKNSGGTPSSNSGGTPSSNSAPAIVRTCEGLFLQGAP